MIGVQLETLFGSNGPPTHEAVKRHAAEAHFASAGPTGGHVGSAGLSVHLSATAGPRLAETEAKVSEPSCTPLAPMAKPISKAPAPAVRATVPIVPAGSLGHFLIAGVPTSVDQRVRGITLHTFVRKPMNDPGLSFDSHRSCTSVPSARRSRGADGHNRLVTTPFAVTDCQ